MINRVKLLSIFVAAALVIVTGCNKVTNPISSNSSSAITSSDSEMQSSTDIESTEESSDNSSNSDVSSAVESSSIDSSAPSSTSSSTISKQPGTTTGVKVPADQLTGRVTNLKGRVIKININNPAILDLTTTGGKARAARDKEIEAKLNCKIQYVLQQNETGGTAAEITKSTLAGKPTVDIWVQNGWPEVIPHYRTGLLQNLDSLKVFDWSEYSSNVELSAIGGAHYHVSSKIDSSGQGLNYIWTTNVMFYNQKLLDQYGITDDITALQNNGQWTWAKFKEICLKFNQNVGNSDPALKAAYEWNYIYDNILGSYKTDWVARDKNGNYTFNAGSTVAQKAQTLYTSLVSSGAITLPEYNDPDPQKATGNAFKNGKAAFFFTYLYQMKWTILNGANQDVKENWGVVEIPQVNAGVENFQGVSYVNPVGYSIPVGVVKANEVATVLNEWMQMDLSYADTKTAFYESYINECLNDLNGDKTIATVSKLYDLCASEKDAKLYNAFTYLTTPGIGNWNIGQNDSWYTHARSIAQGKEALGTSVSSMTDYYNKILSGFTKTR